MKSSASEPGLILRNRGKYSESHYSRRLERIIVFSIYTRSDLNKIRKENVQKYDFIDGSNHA